MSENQPAPTLADRERIAYEVWLAMSYPQNRDHPDNPEIWRDMQRYGDTRVGIAYATADRLLASPVPVEGEPDTVARVYRLTNRAASGCTCAPRRKVGRPAGPTKETQRRRAFVIQFARDHPGTSGAEVRRALEVRFGVEVSEGTFYSRYWSPTRTARLAATPPLPVAEGEQEG